MEAPVSEKTGGFLFTGSVDIENSPSLVGSVVSFPDDNLLTFSIFSSSNIEDLLVLDIDEVSSSVLEDLPPS
jgi:hypothetical protein